jgi:hypothetical protein
MQSLSGIIQLIAAVSVKAKQCSNPISQMLRENRAEFAQEFLQLLAIIYLGAQMTYALKITRLEKYFS